MAKKYFGEEDALDDTLEHQETPVEKFYLWLRVVFKDLPGNTHFNFDFLVSFNALGSLESN
jgi:hypothetical protein